MHPAQCLEPGRGRSRALAPSAVVLTALRRHSRPPRAVAATLGRLGRPTPVPGPLCGGARATAAVSGGRGARKRRRPSKCEFARASATRWPRRSTHADACRRCACWGPVGPGRAVPVHPRREHRPRPLLARRHRTRPARATAPPLRQAHRPVPRDRACVAASAWQARPPKRPTFTPLCRGLLAPCPRPEATRSYMAAAGGSPRGRGRRSVAGPSRARLVRAPRLSPCAKAGASRAGWLQGAPSQQPRARRPPKCGARLRESRRGGRRSTGRGKSTRSRGATRTRS